MRFIILFIVTLTVAFSVDADEGKDSPDINSFPELYKSISHVLKHDKGCLDQLMSSPKLKSITDFWWGYIRKECQSYISESINILAPIEKNNDELSNRTFELLDQCAKAVIFDNWDRINTTIVINPEKECSRNIK